MDQALGFRAVFFVLVVMSIGLFIYAYARLPETTQPATRQRIAIWPVLKRIFASPTVLVYGLLIGGINGVLFSYYAEAPFIFIGHFQMTPGLYGFLGIIVALASILGAMISKRLIATHPPQQIIYIGCSVMLMGAFLLMIVCTLPLPISMLAMSIMVTIFILLLGSGIALPNCLSLALVDFQDVIGTAGAIFSLGYYLLVSVITSGMSLLHNESLLTMPLYFLVLTIMMWFSAKKYIR